VGEDQKTIAKHETQVSFQAKNAASWAPGDYRVEVWMGDQKLSTQQFTIADRSS
jgi:outer membrane usher protein FimD/PapC